MKTSLITIITLLTLGLMDALAAGTDDFSGFVEAEGRLFCKDPLFNEQDRDSGSLAFQPEYYHEWENGNSFIFTPFARLDSADARRTHFDIRELNHLWLADEWELRLGVGKVFWGTTEFLHLVDIINQTDLIENIDEEEKLGQPMAHLSVPREWGVVDMFVLPWFRERTFPGRKGRLRSQPEVDIDHVRYESGAEEHHLDFAFRYSNTVGECDFGIYHFMGTGREPTLVPELNKHGRPVLIPYYEQINQTGLDVQMVAGQWLYKLEALYRTGQGEDFFAAVGGFEYTFVGLGETGMDLGVIGEYAYDTRGDDATTIYQNDAMIGFRLTPNDAASTEFLCGLIQDVENSSRAITIEASRRIGSNWKISLEAWCFFDVPDDDLSYCVRDDDYLQLVLAYYF